MTDADRLLTKFKHELTMVEADERLGYPSANILVNAPLALIQLVLETKRDMLKWVIRCLEEDAGDGR